MPRWPSQVRGSRWRRHTSGLGKVNCRSAYWYENSGPQGASNAYLDGAEMKSNAELSAYQKKIEAIDNVILCVAEAETMVREIGRSLVSDLSITKSSGNGLPKSDHLPWGVYRPGK
jgi:hypothetical protein